MESQLIQGDMKRDREGERKDKLQVKAITREKDQQMTARRGRGERLGPTCRGQTDL